MSERVDVVVIGLGNAGEETANRLLAGGLSVVGVEQALIGGECKNWACVPTKMMIRAADLIAETARAATLAGSTAITPHWSKVADRIRDVATEDWTDTKAAKEFTDQGGRLVRGRAVLEGPGRVRIAETLLEPARGIVLATGTRPAVPSVPGLAETPYWTNRDLVRVTSLPRSVVVLGGGAVGVELAQTLARFGVQVTIIETADRLLPHEEPEASHSAERALTLDGVAVVTGARAARVDHQSGVFEVSLTDGRAYEGERLLAATGRVSNLDGIGIESVGLDPDASTVEVDRWMRAAPGVWAVGDITGKGQFTHVATYQGRVAASDILGEDSPGADYRAVPRIVFSDPEIGAVGLTEQQARERGIAVQVAQASVARSARGWLHGPGTDGVVKLVVDTERQILVGATSVGPVGGEVLGMLTLAIRTATPVATMVDTIYAYPTFHRAIEDALRILGKVGRA